MPTYESLRALVEELTVGDHLLWTGSHALSSTGERARPNTVTTIDRDGDHVRV